MIDPTGSATMTSNTDDPTSDLWNALFPRFLWEDDETHAARVAHARQRSADVAACYRTVLDLVESRGLPMPHLNDLMVTTADGEVVSALWYVESVDKLHALRRALGLHARWVKEIEDGIVRIVAVDDNIRWSIAVYGTVCEKVQVGVETVTVEEPVTTRTVTREEPVYEWRCPDSLLDGEVDR